MHLLWTWLLLVVSAWVFDSFVGPVMILPSLGLAAISESKLRPVAMLLAPISMLWQMYVLLGWAAICAAICLVSVASPTVRHPSPYFIFGVMAAVYVPQQMASRAARNNATNVATMIMWFGV